MWECVHPCTDPANVCVNVIQFECLREYAFTHTSTYVFYVHPIPPLLISCAFCLRAWKSAVLCACKCVRGQPECFNAYIQSFLIHPMFVCRFARVDVHVCLCVLQHAIKMSNDSCSLFTLQPSFLPLEMCLLLVIETLGLLLLSYIKLLNRSGKSAEIFYSSTITATSVSAPF